MPSFGVSIDGFFRKTVEDILADVNQDQLNEISASLNQASTSVIGQFNTIFSNHLEEPWEVAEAVYAAIDPLTATGLALDYLAKQIGLERNPAEATFGTVTFVVNAPVTIPSGTVLALASNPDTKFLTIAPIVAGAPGSFSTNAIAQNTGPIIAIAGDLNLLVDGISQVDSVANPLDLITGKDIEDDSNLRDRYFAAVAATGNATKPAITSAVLQVSGVIQTKVFNNRNDATNFEGVPGHSIEVIVDGGSDDEIAQAIGDSTAAHGGFHSSTGDSGTFSSTVTGESEIIPFSRPVLVPLGFEVDIVVSAADFPVDGDLQIRTIMKDYVDGLRLGSDVILSQMNCPILDIPGTLDLLQLRVEALPNPPINANFIIGNRERATIVDSVTDITINYL